MPGIRFVRSLLCSLGVLLLAAPVRAQQADPSRLTIDRLYASADFRGETFGPTRWLDGGTAYTTLETAASGKGRDLVRYETATAARSILVTAAQLTPAGAAQPLEVEDYDWSPDGAKLLVFTESRPVWRQNNRGDYWVLDRSAGTLRKLGGAQAKPSTLLFAKFSPDGRRVGYVRENNLYVEDLTTGAITALTTDGSRTTINGTFDWVYEEELGLRDGWRWSPDGATIAYWQLDATGVRDFALINNTDSLYAQVQPVQYPKAGEQNSAARVGVVPSTGGATRWFAFEGDPREHYLARMEWAASSRELIIQRLNRLQNRNDVVLADARTLAIRPVLVETDSAWVDVVDDLVWMPDGKAFTWMSERDGWNHVYLVSRDGRKTTLLTPGDYDVLKVLAVDTRGGHVYYVASPGAPAQRYLWRARLDGKGRAERLTPAGLAGTNDYQLSPDARWAWHTFSTMTAPPVMDLVQLPTHASQRVVMANEGLKSRVAQLKTGSVEFFRAALGDGLELPAYLIKPVGFDPAKTYPIVFFVYGGPGSQQVVDRWGGYYLYHQMLAQQGFAVAVVDNRGTGAMGRDFRKIIYGRLGVVETADQAAAARWILERNPWIDRGRVGIWGWSFGGFMTLNAMLQHPDVYAAGIAVAPVTHWKFYDNIYTERYNGLPQQNAKGYDAGSPLTYAGNLRGDLLLVHGTGDDNVHLQNTDAMINAFVAANRQFRLFEYPNRNHGIAGGNTRRHLFTMMTEHWRRALQGGTPARVP
jgi:dipeptidyl-peptidase-4